MARIFFVLSLFAISLLVTNIFLGFRIGDLQTSARDVVQSRRELEATRRDLTATDAQVAAREESWREATGRYVPIRSRVRIHVLLGIAASLVAILVNCITVTYFVGTTRWCREVVDTYQLDSALADRSLKLKRQSYPLALISFLAILTLVVLGAFSDPSGSNFENSDRWVVSHQMAAWTAVVVVGWSLSVQVGKIGANYEIIESILQQVRAVRKERGLEELGDEEMPRFRP